MYSTAPAPVHRPISRSSSPMYGHRGEGQGPSFPSGPGPAMPTYSAPVPVRPSLSRGPSPAPPGEFQIEKRAKSPNPYGRPVMPQPGHGPDAAAQREEMLFRDHVAALFGAKNQPFAASGSIPVDEAQLVLFFRSKTGITYSLDFPIDVNHNVPAALDVLMAACRPHQATEFDDYNARKALFYPTNLPLTTSLELANYPILESVRTTLFPNLPSGNYLTVVQDRLDALDTGSQLSSHNAAHLANDGRAATIIVTLPIRYRGGDLVIHEPETNLQERFSAPSGKTGDIEWVAFPADCEFSIEPVQKGFRLSVTYGVFVKNFNPITSPNAPILVTPTDRFFDLLSPILNMSRGKSIAFHLNHDYGVNPAEVLANSVIPQLKGADALLYNAFKLHKLNPELHWSAGGFIWAMDRNLEFFGDGITHSASNSAFKPGSVGGFGRPPPQTAFGNIGSPRMPTVQSSLAPYTGYPGQSEEEVDAVRYRVQASGAVALQEAGITLLTEWNNSAPVVGKERVYFVSNGELEKLVVNVLLVVYIP